MKLKIVKTEYCNTNPA